MKKHRLAILGSGSLGRIIGNAITTHLSEDYELLGILSRRLENAAQLANEIGCKAYEDIGEVLLDKPDYIIEATSPTALQDLVIKVLENQINLIVLSIGAFADDSLYKRARRVAKENNCRIYMVSGAIGGFDVLRSAMLMDNPSVSISTEKSPTSLEGAPALKDRSLSIDSPEEVFRGSAREAIDMFPKNINVAVATGLVTTGVDDVKTIVRSIPNRPNNKHRIELRAESIDVTIEIDSKPSPQNPGSSALAAWSVIALLENLVSPIVF